MGTGVIVTMSIISVASAIAETIIQNNNPTAAGYLKLTTNCSLAVTALTIFGKVVVALVGLGK